MIHKQKYLLNNTGGLKSLKKTIIHPPTRFERLLDLTVIILLITSFTYIFIQWSELPNPIPMVIDANGHVSQRGEKLSILGLPFIGMLVWLLFSYIERDPRNINLPLYRSHDKAKEQTYNRMIVNMIKNGIIISLIIANWRLLLFVL